MKPSRITRWAISTQIIEPGNRLVFKETYQGQVMIIHRLVKHVTWEFAVGVEEVERFIDKLRNLKLKDVPHVPKMTILQKGRLL